MVTALSKSLSHYASNVPGAAELFEELGLDYCCGGGRLLDQACQEKGLTVDEVLTKLSQIEASKQDKAIFIDWSKESLTSLIEYILATHHVYTRKELEQIPKLLTKVIIAHVNNHPELKSLELAFQSLIDDLHPHLMKEEQILFPYVIALEQSGKMPNTCFGTVQNPIRVMHFEHESAGELLTILRSITNNYRVPENVCPSYRTLYQKLQNLEQDLHKHIHLENNILFPRAIELENKALTNLAKNN
jgi:regulator of cell morphogenesis and NO signaling